MLPFWLFGLLAICVPVFNIYMINQVRKSNLKKKWLKYLAIIVLNIPSITYKALGGLVLELLSFQILLGISFGYMGYLYSTWTFGIPLGGLYLLWQLKKVKDKTIELPASDTDLSE